MAIKGFKAFDAKRLIRNDWEEMFTYGTKDGPRPERRSKSENPRKVNRSPVRNLSYQWQLTPLLILTHPSSFLFIRSFYFK